MIPLNRLLTCAVAGALVATASCGGDGSSPAEPDTETFDVLASCSGTCVAGFLTIVNGFNEIIGWVASGTSNSVADRSLNLETGAFGFDADMDGKSGKEIQVRGTISPLSRCGDGMFVGEVCIAEWDMFHIVTTAQMGGGTFSVVGLGNAGAPYSTPSYRVTIVTEEPWIKTVDGCRLDITSLQLILHPFADPQLISAMVTFKMTSEGLVDEVNGDLIFGYDPSASSQSMTLTGQYTVDGATANISCTVDLDTYALSCS
ncbi:MAG: hypothetical protein LJF06_07960 [Gemmatimonadetes bacterium]|nr:hypothetical protein [Gemmatimonadota bacterium]